MSELDITIKDEIEKMVDEETNRLATYYVDELRKYINSYINSAVRHFKNTFNVNPVINVSIEAKRVSVEFDIPPTEVRRIREAVRKKLLEQTGINRIRIRTLARIISSQLEFTSDLRSD